MSATATATATATAKTTAETTATATATAAASAAAASTSTVTAAVYSQGFLRLLGTFSHHAWAELVLSSQLSLGHGKADDLYHNPRACCAHSDVSLTNLFRISSGLTLGAPAREGVANRGGLADTNQAANSIITGLHSSITELEELATYSITDPYKAS